MKIPSHGLVLLSALTVVSSSNAQISSMGTDFYVSPMPYTGSCDFVRDYLEINCYYNTELIISTFTYGAYENFGESYQAKQGGTIRLPFTLAVSDTESERSIFRTYHIRSTQPVSVFLRREPLPTIPSSCATLAMVLPVAALGKGYTIASLPANGRLGAGAADCADDVGHSSFLITAVADSTEVTITPNGTTYNGIPGVSTGLHLDGRQHPIHLQLQRGESYIVASKADAVTDESGSTVESTEPVAVFSGNSKAWNGDLVDQRGTDERNMIWQQMIPVKFWKSKDNLTMPFLDSPGPFDPGPTSGDLLRLYSSGAFANGVDVTELHNGAERRIAQPFASPSIDNITVASSISADSAVMVEQYDYRQDRGQGTPVTAPTMMNVVPLASYSRSAMFSFDHYTGEHNYINLIAPRAALGSMILKQNGKNAPLSSYPSSFNTEIPNHPELVGRRYSLPYGSYVLTGDSAFEAYQVTNGGLPDQANGAYESPQTLYYEEASPTAYSFVTGLRVIPQIHVVSDCKSITLAVHGSGDASIASISLLEDSDGIFRPSTPAHRYRSYNLGRNFPVAPIDTAVSITYTFADPLLDAHASIRIMTLNGYDTIIEVHHDGLGLRKGSASQIHTTFVHDTCVRRALVNTRPAQGPPVVITGMKFVGQSGLSVSGLPPLPFTIPVGDSIIYGICTREGFDVRYDSLVISNGCDTEIDIVQVFGPYPIIEANDHNFGRVNTNDTVCSDLSLSNSGTAPFTLRDVTIRGSAYFRVDKSQFPLTIRPEHNYYVRVCYLPGSQTKDSAILQWQTEPSLNGYAQKDSSIVWAERLAMRVPNILSNRDELRVTRIGTSYRIDWPTHRDLKITLLDPLGRTIATQRSSTSDLDVETAGLASGVYFLMIESEGEQVIRTIALQK